MDLLKKVILSISIISFYAVVVFAANSGAIEGYVLDSQNENPLPGANVYLEELSLGTSTDLYGKYVISNIKAGEYTLVVEYIGYKKKTIKISIKENKTLQKVVFLDFMAIKGDVINVTTQAEGQMEAINQQLSSNKVVNVVSAARIQELPDNNAAESVGRLPGVSIKRSGGEGNKVVIRGLSPKYNAITVDGVKMASTGSGDRSTDISMISPYMLQGIEVVKAITPDMDADILGGTVNFKLKEAPEGARFQAIAQGGYNNLEKSFGDYKFVFNASNRFFENKIGIFAQVDIENRNRSADVLSVDYNIINPSLAKWDKVVVNSVNFQKVARDRRRYGAVLVLDYAYSDNGSVIFRNFANKSENDVNVQKELFSSSGNNHLYAISDNYNELKLITNALLFRHNFGMFNIEAQVSNSFSENESPLNLSYNFNELSAFTNASGLTNPFSIVDSAKNNIENTYIQSLNAANSYNKENQTTASIDMELLLNVFNKVSTKIKYGGKYRHQLKYNDAESRWRPFQSYTYARDSVRANFPWMNNVDIGSATLENLPYQLFIDRNADSREYLDGQFEFGPAADYDLMHDLYDMLNSTPDNVRLGLNGTPLLWKNWPNSIRDDYNGTEDYYAGYMMFDFNLNNKWYLIPGIRYEQYNTSYTAARGDDARRSEEGYNYHDTTMTRENSYWLPMVHLRYKTTSWLDFRLAYTNTLSRPNYNRIIPSWFLNTGTGRLAYNNYKLKPARSTNYDFSISIHENHIGFFNTVLFYKEIDDLVYNPGEMVVTDDNQFDLPPDLGAETISTTINNKYKATIVGVEFDWQTNFWYLPKPFNGLVLNINYTLMDSETKYPRNEMREKIVGYDTTYVFGQERILPIWQTFNVDTFYTGRIVNQPDNILNISLGYDYKGFSARVSMLYTDNILSGTNFWEEMRSFTDTYVRWDLAVKQKLPVKGLQVYFNLNNFTNAVDRSLIAGNPYPRKEEYYGMTMDLGLRYNF